VIIVGREAAEPGVEVVDTLQQIGGENRSFGADRGKRLTMAELLTL
jgi:hypothetical protein